jgi:translation initiation factor IF-3
VTDRRPGRGSDRNHRDRPRINGSITASTVRLVGADGQMIGVVSIDTARRQARDAGLDLIEIAPGAEPPVCRILDYSKWRYQQDKAAKARRQHTPDTKEVQFGVRIGEGDLVVKLRKAREFLAQGDAVRILVLFKGREVTHPELAERLLERIDRELGGVARAQHDPRKEGRRISLTYKPNPPGR